MSAGTIVIAAIIVVIVLIIMMSIKLVPQGTAAVIERLGRYTKTVEGGDNVPHSICRPCSIPCGYSRTCGQLPAAGGDYAG